jgi:hypothetical protein
MIFPVATLLDYVKAHFPVAPGDMILTGGRAPTTSPTPGAVSVSCVHRFPGPAELVTGGAGSLSQVKEEICLQSSLCALSCSACSAACSWLARGALSAGYLAAPVQGKNVAASWYEQVCMSYLVSQAQEKAQVAQAPLILLSSHPPPASCGGLSVRTPGTPAGVSAMKAGDKVEAQVLSSSGEVLSQGSWSVVSQ